MSLPAALCLLFLISGIRGQEFSLEEALDEPTVKPTPNKDLPSSTKPAEAPKPKPATSAPKANPDGGFSNDDLSDAIGGVSPNDPNETDGHHGGGEEPAQGQEKSVMAGILSAVGVAVVGAVSSFIAYQKKKLCFKGQGEDPENVNMDNQKGDQNDPQAQTNLLAK